MTALGAPLCPCGARGWAKTTRGWRCRDCWKLETVPKRRREKHGRIKPGRRAA